ncbi:ribonuclease Y [Microlunatus panaciterrae]|uniref:Ribonuclease Y n=1 Tax=Microlunatus panaciterrae TaxID=400768 RepID=A0ABS2RRK7_9ACTN|nr:ribonuclease Y [Microlunatus panaciterrae]MBM7800584.1 ribonuclease Y [Microlunatus panaciterrae]
MGIGVFELLILGGLVVLIVLASIAVVFFRQQRAVPPSPPANTETAPQPSAAVLAPDPAESERRALLEEEAAEIRSEADAYHRDARARADALLREAQSSRHDADDEIRAQRGEMREQRLDLERREQRLAEREERLDAEIRALEERARTLDELKADLKVQRKSLGEAEVEHQQALERVAGLTAEQAKAELVAAVEHEAKRRAVIVERDIERQAIRDGETRARSIIVGAIQRVASDQTSESVVSAVHLPGDDMKGRIIGREGRNIRSFEQVTGVNVMIDDTPESVLLSCFDPVRRETARITLAELVKDGRIHPARIEEVHERSKHQIEAQCLRAAEDAMAEVGISDLHPELVPILGALRYRTSYGQNVLKHLVECAHIAGLMAAELRLDVEQCKRAAFLHDIGKALTHEVEGSHALIGADLARKYGENPDVVHAIEAHHNEVEVRTVEAVLTQAADAISGSRPGARRESIEAYVQRLERLEEIAAAREGVEKVFAMQAGREIRVMVAPDVVDDIEAQVLARDIAKQVEEELTYPGQIRIVVVRESRATETAR